MRTRWISIVVSLMMVMGAITVLPLPISAAGTECEITFDFGDGTVVSTTVELQDGWNGFNATAAAAEDLGIELNYSVSEWGVWINGFDGLMNDYPVATWGLWLKDTPSQPEWELSPVGIENLDPFDYGMIYWRYAPPVMPWYTVDLLGISGGEYEVSFDGSSSGANLTYAWDFGDGSVDVSNSSVVEHGYEYGGTYTITMIVSDGFGISETIQEVYVPMCTMVFDFGDYYSEIALEVEAGSNGFNLTQQAVEDSGWSMNYSESYGSIWINSFTKGGEEYANIYPNVTWGLWVLEDAEDDLWELSPVGIDSLDPSEYALIQWRYAAPFMPWFTIDQDGPMVQVNATGSGGDTYTWDFGDGDEASGEAAEHIFDEAGSYNITMEAVIEDFGFGIITQQVDIVGCTVSFDYGNGTSVNATVLPYANWTGFDCTLAAADELDVEVNYTDAGWGIIVNGFDDVMSDYPNATWGLWLKADSTQEDWALSMVGIGDVDPFDNQEIYWRFAAPMSPWFTVEQNSLTVNLDATGSGVNLTYVWDLGDGSEGEGVALEHVYTANGTYNITLTVSDGFGEGIVTQQVSVKLVQASFTIEKRDLNITVNASASIGDGLTYAWDFGDGNTSTGMVAYHVYEDSGNYTVTLTVTDDVGSTDSIDQQADVTAPESATNWLMFGAIAIVIIGVIVAAVLLIRRK